LAGEKTEAVEIDELISRIKAEYNKLIKLWETGRLYFHTTAFMRKFAKKGWLRQLKKENVCAVITMSRLGIPITFPTFKWFREAIINKEISDRRSRDIISYLATYSILTPIAPLNPDNSLKKRPARRFKLSSQFINYLYEKLADLEGRKEE